MLVLTESDPIQAAFKLSHEFRQLSMIEIEFRFEVQTLNFFSKTFLEDYF